MQVTSLLSQQDQPHEHAPGCDCGHDHEHAPVRLKQTLVGVVFVLNAFIVDWAFDNAHTVASASAFIGAVFLGSCAVHRIVCARVAVTGLST